jgi:hypothetical protein
MALTIMTVLLCWVSIIQSVANKPFMVSVVMLIVVTLSVVTPAINARLNQAVIIADKNANISQRSSARVNET